MKPKKSVCESQHFDALFKQHSRTLRNYIYYKCGDENLAEDLVQEAYIKLWNNCKKIPFANALFFLKRVANNAFLNVVKHQKIVLQHQQTKKSEVDVESPEFLLEEKEFLTKLENAIAGLSEKQREVFLLNRIDKKTYAEIAVFLDISKKAVEKRMRNALKTLRKEIGDI
ncbi:sigma-70 family RNA polymerase sigma factor [Kordia algicida OT-1]|uniref:Putative RNA polymerase ECF-type sigma factor n=1 Tax=Kordia algicida OT-1 TaxID=391587 RepID=A9DNE2_9FLAO|nr:sigma-70 family RNA polymerase sigma factor [Kordia algicida]EDP97169.1 putative RNA polymerase ECF-type sigma factor [Kordia algicida OT-1]